MIVEKYKRNGYGYLKGYGVKTVKYKGFLICCPAVAC